MGRALCFNESHWRGLVQTHSLHIRRMLASSPSSSSLPSGPVKRHRSYYLFLLVSSSLLQNYETLISSFQTLISLHLFRAAMRNTRSFKEEFSLGLFLSLWIPKKSPLFSAWFRSQSLHFIYCRGANRWVSRYHRQISRPSAGNSTDRSHFCPIYRFVRSRECISQIFFFLLLEIKHLKSNFGELFVYWDVMISGVSSNWWNLSSVLVIWLISGVSSNWWLSENRIPVCIELMGWIKGTSQIVAWSCPQSWMVI